MYCCHFGHINIINIVMTFHTADLIIWNCRGVDVLNDMFYERVRKVESHYNKIQELKYENYNNFWTEMNAGTSILVLKFAWCGFLISVCSTVIISLLINFLILSWTIILLEISGMSRAHCIFFLLRTSSLIMQVKYNILKQSTTHVSLAKSSFTNQVTLTDPC